MITPEPTTLDDYRRKVTALEMELSELRRQIDELTADDDDITTDLRGDRPIGNLYVFEDDDDEAKAFDAFYRAYDTYHVKTRRFLLG